MYIGRPSLVLTYNIPNPRSRVEFKLPLPFAEKVLYSGKILLVQQDISLELIPEGHELQDHILNDATLPRITAEVVLCLLELSARDAQQV